MADITMSIDDTLELDAIIKEWTNTDTVVGLNGNSSDFDLSGIQTNTAILNPKNPGIYTITVNGQNLDIEVIDTRDIPDSTIHHWIMGSGSGTTLTDQVGSADGDIQGPSWTSGDWKSGYSLDANSSDNDEVELTTLGSFGSNLNSNFAILLTIEVTNENWIFCNLSSNTNTRLDTFLGSPQSAFSNGSLCFDLNDDSGNRAAIETNDSSFSDGNRYRVCFNKKGNAPSNLEIWVNGTEENVSTVKSGTISTNTNDFDDPFRIFARNASDTRTLNGKVDNIILTDDSLNSDAIKSDYERQPWS